MSANRDHKISWRSFKERKNLNTSEKLLDFARSSNLRSRGDVVRYFKNINCHPPDKGDIDAQLFTHWYKIKDHFDANALEELCVTHDLRQVVQDRHADVLVKVSDCNSNFWEHISKNIKIVRFVHIPKTGGSYIESALRSDRTLFAHMGHVGIEPFETFDRARDKQRKDKIKKSIYSTYEKSFYEHTITFTAVRNPFDHLASYYFCGKGHTGNGWGNCREIHNFTSFKQFIIKFCDPDFDFHFSEFKRFMYFQAFEKNMNCCVDFFIKNEELGKNLLIVANNLGLHLDTGNRKMNVSDRPLTEELYDEEMIELVRKKCALELFLFDYDFMSSEGKSIITKEQIEKRYREYSNKS